MLLSRNDKWSFIASERWLSNVYWECNDYQIAYRLTGCESSDGLQAHWVWVIRWATGSLGVSHQMGYRLTGCESWGELQAHSDFHLLFILQSWCHLVCQDWRTLHWGWGKKLRDKMIRLIASLTRLVHWTWTSGTKINRWEEFWVNDQHRVGNYMYTDGVTVCTLMV